MSRIKKNRWNSVLIKISGETLAGTGKHGFSSDAIDFIASEIYSAAQTGCKIALVLGGGNLVRGAELENVGIERTAGDYMGMLATLINGVALQTALEKKGIQTRLLSALHLNQIAEPFIRRRAVRHMEKGRIVLCVGGTGNPFFTTDTAASLRANELQTECIVKATGVDGVYTADPKKDTKAKKFTSITYQEVLEKNLRVMDLTAITLAHEFGIPIVVCDVFQKGALASVIAGDPRGTIIEP